MPKKIKHFIFFILVFFSFAKFTHANLEITEIMYAPTAGADYEWVEIYNNGSSSVDLNKYRFFHGETNSGPLTLRSGSTSVLPSSSYAIIARNSTDYSWLNFSGMIFSASVLSLPDKMGNTYIAISDQDKNIIDSVIYDVSRGGSKTSKSSLSKINEVWKSGIPTPGKENVEMIIAPPKVEEKSVAKSSPIISIKKTSSIPYNNKQNVSDTESQIINLNDLDASAGDANTTIPSQVYPFIGLLVVIGIGITSFLLVKKKKEVKYYNGEETRAKDIKIVE
jgi:hypothetical protein